MASPTSSVPTSTAVAAAAAAASVSSDITSPAHSVTSPATKPRSCAVCRSRKVRCDKLSPCTNCRRANIPCVVPQADRIPRWARRLDRAALPGLVPQQQRPQQPLLQPLPQSSHTSTFISTSSPSLQVTERLRNLESLVRELNVQLQQARAANSSASQNSSYDVTDFASPAESSIIAQPLGRQGHDTAAGHDAPKVHDQVGRLVTRDAHASRYVSSNFWSRIKDEIDELFMDVNDGDMHDSDLSDPDDLEFDNPDITEPNLPTSNGEYDRDPVDKHAFMFRHNLTASPPRADDFRPLPSQVPFLINTFHENVNMFIQAAHVPTVHALARDVRTNGANSLSAPDEALLFSIYYAAVTSMEDDDVLVNFGTTKHGLALKFRNGFEHALARADFLTLPSLTLVQALTIFLYLVRRHDSPRYVWMMVGVAIRMAKALGLHRDGSSFPSLTPFEVEMRRRVWWALYMLDLRSSEDQGTEITITQSTFDTKRPLSINDEDISPQAQETPPERQGFTDMTIPSVYIETGNMSIRFLSLEIKDGMPDIEHHGRLVIESYAILDKYGAQLGNVRWRMAMLIASLVLSKTTLMLYLPVIAKSKGTARAADLTTKLLISSIEVAEFNHELNDEKAFRQWRWMFQTYTQWSAIVNMLIQITRRPWSPTSERAWVALHSPWLIPKYPKHVSKNDQVIVPLRRLMAQSREYRMRELCRLQSNPHAMKEIEDDERRVLQPRSHGIDVSGSDVRAYYFDRWRYSIAVAQELSDTRHPQTGPSLTQGASLPNDSTTGNIGGAISGPMNSALSGLDGTASYDFRPDMFNWSGLDVLHQQQQQQQQQHQQQHGSWSSTPGHETNTVASSDGYTSSNRVESPAGFQSWLQADGQARTVAEDTLSGERFSIGLGDAGFAGDDSMTVDEMSEDMNWYNLIESARVVEWESTTQSGGSDL